MTAVHNFTTQETAVGATGRVEIDFSIYNPFDPEFIHDPHPTYQRMLADYPVAFHTDIKAWMIAPHDLVANALRDNRYSTRFEDWNEWPAAEPKPESEWNLYDRANQLSLLFIDPAAHARTRRLTAPAFSRRVTDQIEAKIRSAVVEVFDEIEDPREFNAAAEIAAKVPIRAIAAMVGVPASAHEIFEHGLGYHLVRISNPMHAAEREQNIQNVLPGLQYLLDLVRERRAAAEQADDFLGTLIATEIDGDTLSDMEIVSLVMALVTAGADTAIDLHTNALLALLTNPEQRQQLRDDPALFENATIEILRWSAVGKFAGIPRFALEDFDFEGQSIRKGEFVMPLLAVAWQDPQRWPEPEKLDFTRNHSGSIVFGAGPHLCIGLNLVKAQAKIMIQEFEKRFGDTAELVGELAYDYGHFNARRITTMMVRT